LRILAKHKEKSRLLTESRDLSIIVLKNQVVYMPLLG